MGLVSKIDKVVIDKVVIARCVVLYWQIFSSFLIFVIIQLAYGFVKKVAKYDKLGRYFPYCSPYRSITTIYLFVNILCCFDNVIINCYWYKNNLYFSVCKDLCSTKTLLITHVLLIIFIVWLIILIKSCLLWKLGAGGEANSIYFAGHPHNLDLTTFLACTSEVRFCEQ